MAMPGSPTYNNGYEEDPIFQKSHYTQDISEQMRVPKRIKATGEYTDEFDLPYGNGQSNQWNPHDKVEMTVPDRILLIGQEQHMGTRTAPREIVLDNSILPPQESNPVRVSTPPRAIKLSEHHFPSATEDRYTPDEEHINAPEYDRSSVSSIEERRLTISKPKRLFNNEYFNSREATPPHGEHVTTSDEILHLRRQVAKLNRRVLTIEFDNLQRQQREKVVYCLGLAYFLFKSIMWLNRN